MTIRIGHSWSGVSAGGLRIGRRGYDEVVNFYWFIPRYNDYRRYNVQGANKVPDKVSKGTSWDKYQAVTIKRKRIR